jgi:hypothetical protein
MRAEYEQRFSDVLILLPEFWAELRGLEVTVVDRGDTQGIVDFARAHTVGTASAIS